MRYIGTASQEKFDEDLKNALVKFNEIPHHDMSSIERFRTEVFGPLRERAKKLNLNYTEKVTQIQKTLWTH